MTGSSVRRYLSLGRVVALNSFFLTLIAAFLAFGQARDTTSLYQAMRDGKVVATFRGTGASSGDSIEVEVAKTPKAGPGPINLTIPPGSMLHSANGAEQSMVIMGVRGISTGGSMFRPAFSITVSDTTPVTYILSAFCAEFEKENPSTTDTFTLDEPVPVLACLAREANTLSTDAKQAAVWQYTDGVTYGSATEKFPMTPSDWSAASSALEHCRSARLQPNAGTPAPVPNVPPARQSTDPQLYARGQQAALGAAPRLLAGAMGETQIAAEEGKSDAQLQMARLYLEGRLVPRDRVTADFWFNVAAASGGETASEAAKQRDHLEKLLTPAQVAQAEEMSRNWKPKEVLEGPLMRAGFVREIESQLLILKAGFETESTISQGKGATGAPIWATAHRFPGASSKACTVLAPDDRIVVATNKDQASVAQKQGGPVRILTAQDLATLDCTIFQSGDLPSARAIYDDVSLQVWDLLPGDWLRRVRSKMDAIADTVSAEFLRSEEEGEKSQEDPEILLTLYDFHYPTLPAEHHVKIHLSIIPILVAGGQHGTAHSLGFLGYEQKSPLPSTAP